MRRSFIGLAIIAVAAFVASCSTDQTITGPEFGPTPSSLSLTKIGAFSGGGSAAAEITAYDPASKRLFIVNGALGSVDVVSLSNPATPTLISTISVAQFGAGANSVAVHNGLVGIAIQATNKTDPGKVAFYRATDLQLLSSVTVGALPDMITFTPSGRYALVANEAEPSDNYVTDPEGSISIIDVANTAAPSVRTAGFASFNGQTAQLRTAGVRIYGPNATVAQDLEPEFITVSDDSRTAYVTLQENNALAVVDINAAAVTSVTPFGYKNHSVAGNGMDVSDRDGPTGGAMVNIRNWPVFGMYQPDGIASYTVAGQTYLVTANEGDAREWGTFVEESRVSALTLNPAVFTDAACGGGPCNANARLGRLTVTKELGRNAVTGQYDALYALGGRSISIWTAAGQQVWDSGDQFEQRTTALTNVNFNASNSGNTLDDRSDNKGPEPEGVALARFGSKTFAFICLERVGGIMVYDITLPTSPSFVTYVSSRVGSGGDLGPEGIIVISAANSPTGVPLLVVGNEVSGTTAIFQIVLQ
ncbi:MAG: choice-of-anchor I family protein [Gemmatimonadota bacterium]|nr:choice-of-anchor I family protein [Gemmatimonadota bacterium]